ncbi:FAD:protein FMN transferase [Roseateles sp. BYS78W]|uniref:FAD:protein FMN transferase n=1 Tax=Pelomonas candidula TaxID=3299025 RepID=A0ABW7HJ75_9BURK
MQRRARPLLGTWVEIGATSGHESGFGAIAAIQARLSRFEPGSDIARFNAMPTGGELSVHPVTVEVLTAAHRLHVDSDGLFDISLGSGSDAWCLDGDRLHKLADGVVLDLGGIGKGHAVDLAVLALQAAGAATGWVNAGGDLRVFGELELPILLRNDACGGGVREFARLADGAFATSHYAPGSRSAASRAVQAHVSVAAPRCLWADALTKVVALSSRCDHPLLARYDAAAWQHDAPRLA